MAQRRRRIGWAALAIGAMLVLGACGSDAKSSSDATTTSSGGAYGGGSGSSSSTTTAKSSTGTSGATVNVADSSTTGKHLVNDKGFTLYLFEKDQGTTSACTGGCSATWPGLTASSPTGGTGVDASMLSTATGQVANQVVYNGHLLYAFAGDQSAGDVNGVSIPDWYPVGPDGKKIDKD